MTALCVNVCVREDTPRYDDVYDGVDCVVERTHAGHRRNISRHKELHKTVVMMLMVYL